jgi:hypothetical protein
VVRRRELPNAMRNPVITFTDGTVLLPDDLI